MTMVTLSLIIFLDWLNETLAQEDSLIISFISSQISSTPKLNSFAIDVSLINLLSTSVNWKTTLLKLVQLAEVNKSLEKLSKSIQFINNIPSLNESLNLKTISLVDFFTNRQISCKQFIYSHFSIGIFVGLLLFSILGIIYTMSYIKDLKHALKNQHIQQQLYQTQQRLQYLLSNNSTIIYSCEVGGNCRTTFVSNNSAALVGYEAEDFLTHPSLWIDNVHPNDLPHILTQLSQPRQQDSYVNEYRFRHQNGTYRWIHEELKYVEDKEGNISELIGYWLDITHRKENERKLEHNNLQLEAILAAFSDLLFRISADGTILEYRFHSKSNLGITLEEFTGKRMQDLFPIQVGKQFQDAISQAQQTKTVVKIEYSLLTASNEEYYEACLISFEREPLLIVIRNISDLKRNKIEHQKIKKSLKNSQALLDLINDIQNQFITTFDVQSLFNTMLINLLELTESEQGVFQELSSSEKEYFQHKSLYSQFILAEKNQDNFSFQYFKNTDSETLNTLVKAIINSGQPIIYYSSNNELNPDKKLSIHSFLGLPFYDNNKIIGIIGIANRSQGYNQALIDELQPLLTTYVNIIKAYHNQRRYQQAQAEIVRLNQQLEQKVPERTQELEKLLETNIHYTVQLEKINKELDAFSYSVSHDLRTPLRHISGFIHALKRELTQNNSLDNPKTAHYLKIIEDSSHKMRHLIDGLLILSQVGRGELVFNTVPLVPLVESAINLVTFSKNTKNIKFIIGNLPTVQGDYTLLQQVFVNLIDNAIKFSQDRSPAIIEINSTPEQTIFVKDNGVGFSREYADKLFGVFQQLHSQEKFKGTGVGLSVVQRIIHRHGGKIWAESELEKGTIFYFKLP